MRKSDWKRAGALALAAVMQVYQQVLRGVDKANEALAGGIMQLLTKIAVAAVGA